MKKTWLIIVSVVLVLALIFAGVGLYIVSTPQYALKTMLEDVKASGMDGLRPHLTDQAGKTLDTITSVTESGLLGGLIQLMDGGQYITVLKDEIQKIQWGVDDVLKGGNSAEVVLSFNYEDKLVGTIEISMIRQDRTWKINALELPKFEKINFDSSEKES